LVVGEAMRERAAFHQSPITNNQSLTRVLGLDTDRREALRVVAHPNAPWAATHLAILDVVLRVTASRIEGDGILLSTIGTNDGPGRVGGAVSEWEFFVEVVKEVDHRVDQTFPRNYTAYTSALNAWPLLRPI